MFPNIIVLEWWLNSKAQTMGIILMSIEFAYGNCVRLLTKCSAKFDWRKTNSHYSCEHWWIYGLMCLWLAKIAMNQEWSLANDVSCLYVSKCIWRWIVKIQSTILKYYGMDDLHIIRFAETEWRHEECMPMKCS